MRSHYTKYLKVTTIASDGIARGYLSCASLGGWLFLEDGSCPLWSLGFARTMRRLRQSASIRIVLIYDLLGSVPVATE
jgi:hypothetical protein